MVTLSSALDTINHAVLVQRLTDTFSVSGPAINWIKSYLSDRPSFVKIGDAASTNTVNNTGVPQGSVLGPILFSLFTTPIGNVVREFGIKFHQYADDMQIYIAVNKNNINGAAVDLASCMLAFGLRLASTTQLVVAQS